MPGGNQRIALIDTTGLVLDVVSVFPAGTAIEYIGFDTPAVAWDEAVTLPAFWKEGAFHPLKQRPTAHHVFDSESEGWIDPRTPEQIAAELSDEKARAVGRINQAAGQTRQRFITDIPGQEMIYKAKLDEARAYLSGPEPATLDAFPLIAAEVGITAPDAFQIAMIWLWMAEIWVQAAAQIEAIRLQGTAGVQAAPDLPGIAEVEARTVSALEAIQP